jgi:diaminohydroxyphosphoribosylaminopyrimidine deaminase/5-amino-6-(5-phosphoribosylamino)uracil reductase
VDEGVGQDVALDQNRPFFTWITRGRPFVVLKTAASRDGFVGRPQERVQLTSAAADRWFQRQRAEIDAIAVGSGTVLTDDPLLTARDVYRHRPLTRVIFDRRARIPPAARLFSTLPAGPVIIIVARASGADRAHELRVEALAAAGAVIERVDGDGLSPALRRLADRGLLSLLVEGGPALQSAFVREGLVDRIQSVMVPVELGHGVPAPPIGALTSGEPRRIVELGPDTVREFDVHRTH